MASFSSAPAPRYLITGGQGFLGSQISRSLFRNKTKPSITLFDISHSDSILKQVLSPVELPQLQRTYGDVSNFENVWEVVKEVKPTHIIHLAALQVPGCRADTIRGGMINVLGHINMFEAARKLEAEGKGKVESMVYASSAAVAGAPENYSVSIEDDTPHIPRTHYGVFKIANENNARVYWVENSISSIGLRPHTIYGVGREIGITSGVTKAIKSTVLGKPYQFPFSGFASFVFGEDAADLFVKSTEVKTKGAYALNIRGTILSVDSFLQQLQQVLPESKGLITTIPGGGPKLPLAFDFRETGLKNLLGETRYTPIKDGILKTANAFKELHKLGLLSDEDLNTI